MDALGTILLIALICAAVLPLLALVVYIVASALGLGFADRILDATVALLTAQWSIGGVLNIVAGAAIIAVGIWCAVNLEPALVKALCLVLVPFGIWRLVRGARILRAARGTPAS
ncbi:hypothetical protein SAMN06295879_2559 [Agreia bicolorata]|uniref:Uncharacterized protein n=1 Tax=Agreia bicolorata TaxID=110935 RepID=A0A1T4Y936_9MICO|nr:hypothetical protein [Agreia bicolorata]SKA98299.1 hypothetical protein SAMN06295879_2559 [Agreia bicolorata]